ncbi:uncharacterized protein VTP21DRAFT_9258 [Calcarisporiella thermophila]|uniref:uncharacterized protein n=1 Tax=Calcarisporiella thermophila TaxID=911321 RepID=UPI003743AB05
MSDQKATSHKKKKENLKWQINLLEAKCGLEPSIQRAKAAVRKSKDHKTTEDAKEGADDEKLLMQLRGEKISRKLFHEKKELKKGLKKAKVFETQRLVKRLRNARVQLAQIRNQVETGETSDEKTAGKTAEKSKTEQELDADVKRYEADLDIVKRLDLDRLVDKLLRTKLSKHPTLKSHPLMQQYIDTVVEEKGTPPPQTSSIAATLVDVNAHVRTIEARLLGRNTVKEVFERIFKGLEVILFGKTSITTISTSEKRKRGEGSKSEVMDNISTTVAKKLKLSSKNSQGVSDEQETGFEGDVEISGATDFSHISTDNDDDEIAQSQPPASNSDGEIEDRVHGNSFEDIDEEEASDEGENWERRGEEDEDEEGMPYADGYDSDGEPIDGSAKRSGARRANDTGSLFIDSLQSGFIDGEMEPWERQEAEGKSLKKNRMGQRARRQLWEKKYGKNAKHVQKSQQRRGNKDERSKNGPHRAGAGTSGSNSKGADQRHQSHKHEPKAKRFSEQKKAAPQVDEELHPSWVAKQQQKEAMQKAMQQAKSTKIVFNDDSD